MIRWRRHIRTRHEAILCLRIAGAIPLIWLGAHALPLPALLARLTPPAPASSPPVSPDRVLYLADRILDRPLPGVRATCLLRSLVLFRFLREAGAPVRFHLGAASAGSSLTGHAWLTLDDRPLLESGDPASRFTTVLLYPAP